MTRPTQAVILAAGRGSRMGPVTGQLPKCLVRLAGQPILLWTLKALQAQGIERVLLIGGWCAEQLSPWVRELRVNPQWQTSNMVRSLMLASDWLLAAPTLVVYGDGAYGERALSSALAPSGHELVVPIDVQWIQLWKRRFKNPLDDAESLVREGRKLLNIGAKSDSLDDIQGQFMGLLRTTPAGWMMVTRHLETLASMAGSTAIDRLDMTGLLSSLLHDGVSLHVLDVFGGWVEIDSQLDLKITEQALQEPCFSHDFRY